MAEQRRRAAAARAEVAEARAAGAQERLEAARAAHWQAEVEARRAQEVLREMRAEVARAAEECERLCSRCPCASTHTAAEPPGRQPAGACPQPPEAGGTDTPAAPGASGGSSRIRCLDIEMDEPEELQLYRNFLGHSIRLLKDEAAHEPRAGTPPAEPPKAKGAGGPAAREKLVPVDGPPGVFRQVGVWKIADDASVVVGSRMLCLGNVEHPKLTLFLHNEKVLSDMQLLEHWVECLIAGVPEFAVCFHRNGAVQSYTVYKVSELRSFLEERLAIGKRLQMTLQVLRWIKRQCCLEGCTYWLSKAKSEPRLKLFKLCGAASAEGSQKKVGLVEKLPMLYPVLGKELVVKNTFLDWPDEEDEADQVEGEQAECADARRSQSCPARFCGIAACDGDAAGEPRWWETRPFDQTCLSLPLRRRVSALFFRRAESLPPGPDAVRFIQHALDLELTDGVRGSPPGGPLSGRLFLQACCHLGLALCQIPPALCRHGGPPAGGGCSPGGDAQADEADGQAGNFWSPEAASARGRDAGIWRQLHAAAAARAMPPPRFRRAPARRSPGQALEEGIRQLAWLDNCSADIFANLGAAEIKLPNGAAEAIHAELQRALVTADYVGWAAARICQVDPWRPPGEGGKLMRKAEPKLFPGPQLGLTRHEYQTAGVDGAQCIRFGAEAYAGKARTLLDCRPRAPSRLGQMRAAKSQSAAGAQLLVGSEAVNPAAQEHLQAAAPTGREGDLEDVLTQLASWWITDLQGQSHAYACWLQEGVNYVSRLLGAPAFSGFFRYVSADRLGAEKPRKAEEFCERGWHDDAPFREAHIDQALQLEGEALGVRLRQFRGYVAASAWAAADDEMELFRGLQASAFEARRARRRQGAAASSGGEGLQLLGRTVMVFAGDWIFDRRDPDGAESSWRAWAARFVVTWLRQPANAAAYQMAAQGVGSVGVQATVKEMVEQAWQRKVSVRQAAYRHLLDLPFPAWHHVVAMLWASIDEVARAIEALIGPTAMAQLPVLPGFAGPLPDGGPPGALSPPRTAMLPLAVAWPPALDQAIGAMASQGQGHGRPRLPRLQQLGLADFDSDGDGPDPGAAPLPGVRGGAGPVHAPADDASWRAGSGAEGPGSGASQGVGSSGAAAATSGAVVGGHEAEADINGPPQWAQVGLRTPEAEGGAAQGGDQPPPPVAAAAQAALATPVAAACVLAAAAAATSPPGPSGASDGAGPPPAAARRSRSPRRRQAGRAPQSEIAVPSTVLGHGVREAGQHAFCCRCGAFAELQGADRVKGLKKSCGGRIPQGTLVIAGQKKKRLCLGRLLGRCDPYTGKLLG
ncbi:unnamed protein product [Prorocentrum cordatum]|uniref:EDRF1 N-terminal domain-containing protein n=1 Tax=Prorocentrum cordatum TaxID=2364126 RepID=A0ABN9XBD2_9DINO|nr:unnamed protein product [Polarella glacialis]